MSTAPVVVLDDVSRRFGDVTAVEHLSMTIETGRLVGLIGPSGAGKTTAIRLLTGGIRPTTGRVEVLGRPPQRLDGQARSRIGFMPQEFALYDELTVRENVDFVATLFGLSYFQRRRRVPEILRQLELWDLRGRAAGDASGGQRRRISLASALVHRPDLIFLDEPTAGLDPLLRMHIWELLRGLRSEGRTLVVTTQYMADAEACDQVALIALGRLIAFDTPTGLRRTAEGGEVIVVHTAEPFDGASLPEGGPGRIQQIGPRELRVVAGDAGSATPALVGVIEGAGGHVTSVDQIQPSFDEVFATLVARATSDAAA